MEKALELAPESTRVVWAKGNGRFLAVDALARIKAELL